MTINYLTRVLIRRIWILITVPIIALLAVLFFTKDYKRKYLSTAQLTTGFTVRDQVRVTDEKLSIEESEVKFNNVIQVLTSQKVVNLTAYYLVLHELESPVGYKKLPDSALKSKVYQLVMADKDKARRIYHNKLDSMQILTSTKPEERKLLEFLRLYEFDYDNLLKSQIQAFRVENTDYINVTAKTDNPDLSAAMVNALCHQFLRINNSQRVERFGESITTFKALADQKRLELEKKSNLLRGFKSSHGVLNLDNEGKSKNDLIKDFSTSLSDAQNGLYSAQVEMSNVSRRLDNLEGVPAPEISASKTNAQILKLRDDISETKHKLDQTDDDKTRKKLSDLRNQLADAENKAGLPDASAPSINLRDDLENRKNNLDVKIKSLQQSIEDYKSKLQQLQNTYGSYASKEATIASLQKDADLAQKEYSTAEEKYNQALDVNSAATTENIRQTLFGQPAVRPEPSQKLLIILITLISSVLVCLFSIILIEYLDGSLKNPDMFSDRVGLPLIGLINKLPSPDKDLLHIINDPESRNPKETTFRDLIKKAKFNIEKSGDRIFLVTSTKSSEGKTTLIIALATVLAGARKKVLLIDTNFMNNSITRYFQSKPALEDLGQLTDISEKTFKNAISTSPVANLDVIGCKGGLYSPSDVLLESSFISNLSILTASYDYVFMEGASLNKYSDSKELTEYADGVIGIFSSHSTIHPADQDSIEYLHSIEGKFRGAILNNVLLENINL